MIKKQKDENVDDILDYLDQTIQTDDLIHREKFEEVDKQLLQLTDKDVLNDIIDIWFKMQEDIESYPEARSWQGTEEEYDTFVSDLQKSIDNYDFELNHLISLAYRRRELIERDKHEQLIHD